MADDYSVSGWWSDSGNSSGEREYSADPGPDVPGYDANSVVPGTQQDPPNAKTDFPPGALNDNAYTSADYTQTDQLTSAMDSSSAASTQNALGAMASGAIPALRQAVDATPPRVLGSGGDVPDEGEAAAAVAGAGTASAAGGPGAAQPPAAVNVWNPVQVSGHLAAQLVYTDSSLIAALESAASAAGGQAALMQSTLRLQGDTVVAGGSQMVGATNPAPAQSLVEGSEYGGAKQFHCGPWFFPAVAAWAASHPPPVDTGLTTGG